MAARQPTRSSSSSVGDTRLAGSWPPISLEPSRTRLLASSVTSRVRGPAGA